ncbi:hypothetical protein GF352_00130 [archaeon]|nr:hypothetical protein [archaeon]
MTGNYKRVPKSDKLAYIRFLETNDLVAESPYVSKLELKLKLFSKSSEKFFISGDSKFYFNEDC